jgi:hypothetical protein
MRLPRLGRLRFNMPCLAGMLLVHLLALGAGCDEAEGGAEASAGTGSRAGTGSHAGEGGSAAPSAMAGSMHISMDASVDATPRQHEPTVDAAADAPADATSGSDAALTGACKDAQPLHCGDRLTGATPSSGEDLFSLYACTARAESGSESVYAFRAEHDCQVSARLTELEEDLDLFVFDTCDALSCIEASPSPLDIQRRFGGEWVSFHATAGKTQVIVVDGYNESHGAHALAVDCLCGESAESFADGDFVLRVTRRWDGDPSDIALPSMAFDEDDYQAVAPTDRYEVVISQVLDHVTITPETEPAIEGTLAKGTAGTLSYVLDAFAGGRLLIWTSGSGLQAELTLYGSGVPIVSSERGELIAEP